MEGNRKLLATVVFGLLSLAALVLIILLKQFTAPIFTAWITGTAGVFGVYMGANVVSKFSPTDVAAGAAASEAAKVEAAKPAPAVPSKPPELGGDGLLGISGANHKK